MLNPSAWQKNGVSVKFKFDMLDKTKKLDMLDHSHCFLEFVALFSFAGKTIGMH